MLDYINDIDWCICADDTALNFLQKVAYKSINNYRKYIDKNIFKRISYKLSNKLFYEDECKKELNIKDIFKDNYFYNILKNEKKNDIENDK